MAPTKELTVVLERLRDKILKDHGSGKDEVEEFSDKLKSKTVYPYSVLSKKIRNYEQPKSEANILNTLNIPNSSQSKKYFCIFCKKMFSKLVKHLEAKHKEEPDVKKITVFPRGNKERLKIIDDIRKKGAFEHNTDKNYNKGVLIVARRPKPDKSKKSNDYRTCPNCKGFFSKTSIRRHYPKCFPQKQKNDHMMLKYGNKVLSNVHCKACPTLRDQIFPVFRDDNVVNTIRYDELVMVYGNHLCSKYRSKHLHNMIRARLRAVGRFILEMRKIDDGITCFSDIYVPEKFDNVINAINNVAQLDETGTRYKAPATASNLTTVIKFCGELWIIECIKKQDNNRKVLAEDFLSIFKKDVLASINKTVTENQLEKKRKKTIVLPSTDDIKLLNDYLNRERAKAYENLLNKFDYDEWLKLAETTLTSIQIFNRRRAGEIERITIEDFNTCQKIDRENDEDVCKSLSEEEKKALDSYYRFVIRGKLGRGVPVLIRNELYLSVKLVLLRREEAGVGDKNAYVFGLPGSSQKRLSACSLMRRFSVVCGAKQPKALRGTELRKHIATQSVHYNLQDNEVTDLADFLGHAEKIHRTHYRLPVATRDITKISRILEKAQGEDIGAEEIITEAVEREHICADSYIDTENSCIQVNNSDKDFCDFNEEDRIINEVEQVLVESTNINNYNEDSDDSVKDPLFVSTEEPAQEGAGNEVARREGDDSHDSLKDPDYDSEKESDVEMKNKTNKILKKRKREFCPKRTWSGTEKAAVVELFSGNFKNNILPPYNQCKQAIKTHAELKNRTAKQLYAYINNCIKKKRNPGMTANRKKIKRCTWTTPEKKMVTKYFAKNIHSRELPTYHMCSEVVEQHKDVFKGRTTNHLYAYVNNLIKKTKSERSNIAPNSGPRTRANNDINIQSPSKNDIQKWFKTKIADSKIPTPVECAEAILKLPSLWNKNVNYVQSVVHHEITKRSLLQRVRKNLLDKL